VGLTRVVGTAMVVSGLVVALEPKVLPEIFEAPPTPTASTSSLRQGSYPSLSVLVSRTRSLQGLPISSP
jgi:hypothetical protein